MKKNRQNRIFVVSDRDILAVPVDVIVNPANYGLSHGGGLAERILLYGTYFKSVKMTK